MSGVRGRMEGGWVRNEWKLVREGKWGESVFFSALERGNTFGGGARGEEDGVRVMGK